MTIVLAVLVGVPVLLVTIYGVISFFKGDKDG